MRLAVHQQWIVALFFETLEERAAPRRADPGVGDQRQAGHLFRVAGRIERGDMPAHRVTGQVQAADAQGVDERGQAFGLGTDVIAAMGPVTGAEAGQVHGDHVIALGQRPGKPQPGAFIGSEAVNQQHGLCALGATFVVADLEVVDVDAALVQPGAPLLDALIGSQLRCWRQVQNGPGSGGEENECGQDQFLHAASYR